MKRPICRGYAINGLVILVLPIDNYYFDVYNVEIGKGKQLISQFLVTTKPNLHDAKRWCKEWMTENM